MKRSYPYNPKSKLYKRAKVAENLVIAKSRRFSALGKFRTNMDTGPEKKYCDNQISGNISNAANYLIGAINLVTQGTTNAANGRIGGKILMTDISFDLFVQNLTASLNTVATFPAGADSIRVAIVYDKQSNGVAPTVADIWNTGAVATGLQPFAPVNVDNIERFVILFERKINLNPAETTSQRINGRHKAKLPVRFDTNTGTTGDYTSGALWLIAYDQNATNTLFTTMGGMTRVLYTDD